MYTALNCCLDFLEVIYAKYIDVERLQPIS